MSRIQKLWKRWKEDKGLQKKTAGAACLLAAVVLLGFLGNMDAGAQTVKIVGLSQTYEQDTDGSYLVETEAQFLELRDVEDVSVTKGKIFKLKSDLSIKSSLTARGPATGTFAGTFDGNGYRLIFSNVNLSSSSGTSNVNVKEGLLFGTLAEGSSVRNLIVELPENSIYRRNYDREAAEANVEKIETVEPAASTEEKAWLQEGKTANVIEDKDIYDSIIKDGEKVYIKKDNTEVLEETEYNGLLDTEKQNYTEGRRQTVEAGDTVKTTNYTPNAPEDDSFGVICGENNGSIEKVSIVGSIQVAQETTASLSEKKEKAKTIDYYYYTKGTEKVNVPIDAAVDLVESTGETKINPVNPGSGITAKGTASTEVSIQVTSNQSYYKKGDLAVYTVTVQNTGSKEISSLSITADQTGGTWALKDAGATGTEENPKDLTLDTGELVEYTYTRAVSNAEEKVTFSVSGQQQPAAGETDPGTGSGSGSGSSTPAAPVEVSNSATITVYGYTLGTDDEKGPKTNTVKENSDDVLKISQEVVDYSLTQAVYKVTLENLSTKAKVSQIAVSCTAAGGAWFSDEACTEPASAEEIAAIVLAKDESTALYYRLDYEVVNAGRETITNNVTVSCQRNAYTFQQEADAYARVKELKGASDNRVIGDYQLEPGSEKYENYAASNLYTGIVSGTNKGSISEIRQAAEITAEAPWKVTNGADLFAGQLAGRQAAGTDTSQAAAFSGNLLEGKATAARPIGGTGDGNSEIGFGQALGLAETAVTIQESVIPSAQGEAYVVGKERSTGLAELKNNLYRSDATADRVEEEQNSGRLSDFEVFQLPSGDSAQEKRYTLSWLYKDNITFTYEKKDGPGKNPTVAEASASGEQGRVYVPKEMRLLYYTTETSEESGWNTQKYFTWKTGEIELSLGQSGYVMPVSAYATDGHYQLTGVSEAENLQYFFTTQAPESAYQVVRKTGTASGEDPEQDVLKLSYVFADLSSGKETAVFHYYAAGEDGTMGALQSAEAVFEEGSGVTASVEIPFTSSELEVRGVWEIDGQFYPFVDGVSVNQDDREPIAAAGIEGSAYYRAGTQERWWQTVDESAKYQAVAGQLFRISESDKKASEYGYSYMYYFDKDTSATLEVSRAENLASACEESGQFYAPEEAGAYKLYVLTKKTGHNTVMKTFQVTVSTDGADITVEHLLADGKTEAASSTVSTGDILRLGEAAQGQGIELYYFLSDTRQTDLTDLRTVAGGAVPFGTEVSLKQQENQKNQYLYVQMFTADGGVTLSTEVREYSYQYMTAVQAPTILPGTSRDEEFASELASGSTVTLSGLGGSSRIYYVSAKATGSITAPVVSPVTDKATLEAVKAAAGKADEVWLEPVWYIKSNDRWYQVKKTSQRRKLERYESGFTIDNESTEQEYWYVYALMFSEGYEPSQVATYVYKLAGKQQVEAPTADLPTGENGIYTEVKLGTFLTFSTKTPGAVLQYRLGGEQEFQDYDPDVGIEVTGKYGEIFQVYLKGMREGMADSAEVSFSYRILDRETAAAPTATPTTSNEAPTTVIPGEKIVLSTTTRGASIYYTTDGSEPEVELTEEGFVPKGTTSLYESSKAITMPEGKSGYFTIKAIAVKEDLSDSSVVQLTYQYPGEVLAPYATVASGKVDLNTEVSLKSATEGAVIYYEIAYGGAEPAEPTVLSTVFDTTRSLTLTQETKIRAIAVKDNIKSQSVSFHYTVSEKSEEPSPGLSSGMVVVRGTSIPLTGAGNASVYYTLDGSDPSDGANTAVMTGSQVTLDGALGSVITVKVCSKEEGKSPSDVSTYTYQISKYQAGISCDTADGTELSSGAVVNLITDVTDAVIYYTVDGSMPGTGSRQGSSVKLEGEAGSSVTVKAMVDGPGESNAVAYFQFKLKEKPAAPTASPSGGVLTTAARVTLVSAGGKIYYTTDGSTPTANSSLYTEPILVNKAMTIRAVTVSDTGEVSDVASYSYSAAGRAAAPEASIPSGPVEPGTKVSFTSATSGAYIYYSTDGTTPTVDNLTEMMIADGDEITINRSVQIQAVAYKEGLQLSSVASYTYEVDTIPAVVKKQEQQALLEQEQLKDSDSTGLARRTDSLASSGEVQEVVLRDADSRIWLRAEKGKIPEEASLRVTQVEKTSGAEEKVKALLGEKYKILGAYDIEMLSSGVSIQPAVSVRLGLPVQSGYENAAVQVVYVDGEDNIQLLDTSREQQLACVNTSQMGTYAVVGLTQEEAQSIEIDYLLLLEIAAGLVLLIGICYYIKKKLERFRQRRKGRRTNDQA